MKKLQCQSCNSSLEWNGEDDIVTCEYCGMSYQMQARSPQERMMSRAKKGDCFAPRPCFSGDFAGAVLYNSWLPKDWQYESGVDPDPFRHGYSMMTPICPYIEMWSPDKKSRIEHYTTNGYVDPAGADISGNMSGSMFGMSAPPTTPTGDAMFLGKTFTASVFSNDPSSLGVPSFIRYRPLVSASYYCDELAQLDGWLSDISPMSEHNEMDELARARNEQIKTILPDSITKTMWWDWCRKLYRGSHAGVPYVLVVEVQISTSGFNVEEAQARSQFESEKVSRAQQRSQQGKTGFFSGLLGSVVDSFSEMTIPKSTLPRWWQTDYEILFACPADDFENLYPEFFKVLQMMELGSDFKACQDKIAAHLQQEAAQAQGIINNAAMQMAADRAASWDRKSAIIADTNAYTSNVMHDMMASNSASHDRSMNMTSEMIGGYNVYQGSDGRLIQADTAFDHVYQGTGTNSDWLVGVEGDWLEPGVDFVPLDQIKGGRY